MKFILNYILGFIPLLLSTLIAFSTSFGESAAQLEIDIAEQPVRLAAIEEAYKNGDLLPVNEADFFDGNLEAELQAGIKFNEISFIATHNSYQKASVPSMRKIYRNLSQLTFGAVSSAKADFDSRTLTQQFNCGIRSIEMDIETVDKDGHISFACLHSPPIDMSTTCYDFALALKEISIWSDNNPNHLPITIIVEPKRVFLPINDMKFFSLEYAKQLDTVLRDSLGDKLFTPKDMLRDYNSFGEMRAADDWCKVSDMLGKVLVLLHDTGATEDYIALDPSIKSQAMFPMLREGAADRECASFLLINNPEIVITCKDEMLDKQKLIVRTRTDKYTDANDERLKNAIYSGAQIVSTDFPPRDNLQPESFVVCFGNNKTASKVK